MNLGHADLHLTQVSIIIPCFGRKDLTAKCLDSIYANTPPVYELILVDNGSQDGTWALLEFLQPEKHQTIKISQNIGFGRATNVGAAASVMPFLLCLNNDTEVQPGWLEPLLAAMDDPKVGAAAGRLVNPDGSLQHAGVRLFHDSNGIYTAENIREEQPAGEAQCLAGTALLVRAEAWDGGFDPGFYNGYEDVDLCLRIRQNGWTLAYTPESTVMHHCHASGPSRWARVRENIARLHEQWGNGG